MVSELRFHHAHHALMSLYDVWIAMVCERNRGLGHALSCSEMWVIMGRCALDLLHRSAPVNG